MSSLLEQAIIDAQALREAAVKNAESAILDKYSTDIREAVESLLEQEEEEPMFENPFALIPAARAWAYQLPLGVVTGITTPYIAAE